MRAGQPSPSAFPELATRSPRAVAVPAVKNETTQTASQSALLSIYESGSLTRRTVGWRAPTTSPNTSMLMALATIRDRSRQAVRNDGFAKGMIEELVSNLIGTGIQPLSKADDETFRREIQALWLQWTDESDADGQLDLYGQQTQAARAWLEAGEVFVRLRPRLATDGLSVPLQIQVIEPELCPHSLFRLLPNGNKVRAGKEFDQIGRIVAYWFYPARTNDADEINYGVLKRIPAETVVHIYDPLRAGQLRGLPVLTQTLVRLHHLDKFDDATLLGQELKNLFVGFVRSPLSDNGSTLNPLTGLPVDGTERPFVGMEPGIFQELAPGEEVTFSNPPAVPQTYPDFMRQQLMAAGTAAGVPYELWTGDMRGLNDRVMRVVLQKFRRRIQALQHQIIAFKFCRPIWNAWMDRVFLSGALPIPAAYVENPEPWQRAKWMPQGWPYLNPVQDIQANKESVRGGFTSRSAAVAEQGEDAEVIDAEQAQDNARADALGLPYDSDARQPTVLRASVAETPTSAETEASDGEPATSSTQKQGAAA